jgi:hypothetical protein
VAIWFSARGNYWRVPHRPKVVKPDKPPTCVPIMLLARANSLLSLTPSTALLLLPPEPAQLQRTREWYSTPEASYMHVIRQNCL